jgi:hypothetical protein
MCRTCYERLFYISFIVASLCPVPLNPCYYLKPLLVHETVSITLSPCQLLTHRHVRIVKICYQRHSSCHRRSLLVAHGNAAISVSSRVYQRPVHAFGLSQVGMYVAAKHEPKTSAFSRIVYLSRLTDLFKNVWYSGCC